MLVVQVVLLNLLIAIMSDTHTRVHDVSHLVAKFERAKLVLEEEQSLMQRFPHALAPARLSVGGSDAPSSRPAAPVEAVSAPRKQEPARPLHRLGLFGEGLRNICQLFFPPVPQRCQVAPRWLHVLLPAELNAEDVRSDGTSQELRTLRELRTSVSTMHDSLQAAQQNLVDMIGTVDRDQRERQLALSQRTLQALTAALQRANADSTVSREGGHSCASGAETPTPTRPPGAHEDGLVHEVRELRSQVGRIEARLEETVAVAVEHALAVHLADTGESAAISAACSYV